MNHRPPGELPGGLDLFGGEMDDEEFYGCARACWPRNKPWKHTLVWGECALAPESARPEPRLTVLRVRTMEDDQPGLVGESLTVTELAARVEKALRTVLISPKCEHLAVLDDDEYMVLAVAVAVDLIEEGR